MGSEHTLRLHDVRETLSLVGVWAAVLLHLAWAGLLIASGSPRRVTGLYALTQLFPARAGLAVILITVAGCALAGIFVRLSLEKVLLLVPQQLVLGISAAGAARGILVGHYADGVVRPHVFLAADLLPIVLLLLAHSGTIVFVALRAREEGVWK